MKHGKRLPDTWREARLWQPEMAETSDGSAAEWGGGYGSKFEGDYCHPAASRLLFDSHGECGEKLFEAVAYMAKLMRRRLFSRVHIRFLWQFERFGVPPPTLPKNAYGQMEKDAPD